MPSAIDRIQGCLIDLDGTVYQEGRAIDGAMFGELAANAPVVHAFVGHQAGFA